LRNRADRPAIGDSSHEALGRERLDHSIKLEAAAPDGEGQSTLQPPTNHDLVSFDDQEHSAGCERVEREGGSSDNGDNDHKSEGGSEQAFSRCSAPLNDRDSSGYNEDADAKPEQISLADEEYESLTSTRSRQVIQYDQAVLADAAVAVDMYHESGDGDIDVRSIGVYNIGVVWAMEQHEDAVGIVNETQQKSRAMSLSSSRSSSSAQSSASSLTMHRDEWHEQLGGSRDDENDDEAFEVEFYQQLKNRLATSAAAAGVDERNEGTAVSYQDESGEEGKSESDSDFYSKMLNSTAVQASRRKISPAAKSGVYRQQSTRQSPPNAGLMRLIRETDDSLSVIDREARKLDRKQRERSEREKEMELQKRIEAEKKALIEKDTALEAVMATLTGKHIDSEASDVEDEVHSRDEENELQAAQYKRLEEIMDEVEQERAREDSSGIRDELTPSASKHGNTREPPAINDRMPASPSLGFWDHMVSAPTANEFTDTRPRVRIDDSELVAQREARLREDEQKDGCVDSPPRVHSPRTLSRRLMAAVDYQETIFEAHMQLNMMEHAQELETVQVETITLAQAFKEEMEQNATSHQLALDHATLEKKFDGDLQEVVQQLDTIRQLEEEERATNESRMEHELRLAKLRECSVQTEVSPGVDAATSASLYVDVSTSPLRTVVDAAVQHETVEQSPSKEASVAEYDNDLEYASEEESNAYEETFEKESQVQVQSQIRANTSASVVPSIAESRSNSPPESEKDSDGEIQSVISELSKREGDDDFEESAIAKSIADEECFAEESVMVRSAVESVIDDEVHVSESSHSTTGKDESSVSMEYEDDFAASSPTVKTMASAVESVIDDRSHENEPNRSTTSKDDDSASMEYEDDFEASSPKMNVIPNRNDRINQEASVEDAVVDEVVKSDGSRGHNQEESDESKSGEQVVRDDVESDHYSSQFEVGLHDVSKDEKKLIAKPAVTSNAKTSTVQKPSLGLNIAQPVAATYIRDLERRKQAEESLLDLRLQAVEQKYQRELKQLENRLGNEQLGVKAAHELKIREETLTMAFLAETANVESLKAASTSRYYQDLHAFRSLSLDWSHRATPNDAQSHQYEIAASVDAPPPAFLGPSDGENAALAERTGDYDDDFASDAGSSHGEVDDNVCSHRCAQIDTEHSERQDHASDSSDVPEASDVAEEDLEQANKEDPPDSLSEEEEEYDDEFASIGEDASVRRASSVDEVAENSKIADQGKSSSASEYDDDFASGSESTPDQLVGRTSSSAVAEVEMEEQDVEENGSPSDAGEISSGSEIVEDEPVHHSAEGGVGSDDIIDSDQRKYSYDEFESDQLEQSAPANSEVVLGEQSGSVREGQSSAEDSSTTKLLVAEVATLQHVTGEAYNPHALSEDSKLARKKAVVEELLQAKERLINQQKEAFRREEEKRQVDVIAKLALGMDVESALCQAKAEVAQQLAVEFHSLQQTYPMLRATSTRTGTAAAAIDESKSSSPPVVQHGVAKDAVPTPMNSAVMTKLFGKDFVMKTSVVEDAYEEEYEAESFEEEKYEGDVAASDEVAEVESRSQDDLQAISPELAGRSDDEIASEGPSHQSEDGAPSVVDEEEEHVANDEGATGAQVLGEEYDSEYENESFDEEQSASGIQSDSGDGAPAQSKEPSVPSIAGTLGRVGYDGEDGYYEDDFDNAAESFTADAPPHIEATPSPDPPRVQAVIEGFTAEIPAAREEDGIKEEDLTSAVETVKAQLSASRDHVIFEQREFDPTTESVISEDKPLASSVSLSQLHEEDEGPLTKSIEERTARLEALRQQIVERKSEILAVQKQMRVEHHRERLVAEEKLLWSDMESVERLLHADEAALALCRQRNRLELMYLEAKQGNLAIGEKSNKGLLELGLDLLVGFDYVEDAQFDGQQRSCLGLSPAGAGCSSRGVDLLGGYAYVEAVEPRNPEPVVNGETLILHEDAERARLEDETSEGDSVAPATQTLIEHVYGDSREPIAHNETKDARGDAAGEPSTVAMEYPRAPAADCAPDIDLRDSAGECFTIDTDAQPVEANVRSTVARSDREKEEMYAVVTSQAARTQQIDDQEASEELRLPKNNALDQQDALDLLADFAFVEVADAVSCAQEEPLHTNLLRDFDHVEKVESVELLRVGGAITAEVHASEKLDDICADAQDELNEAISSSGDVVEQSAGRSEITEVSFVVPQANAQPHAESVGESLEGADTGNDMDEDSPIDAASFVGSDPVPPSTGASSLEVLRKEEVADRVACLLYNDLFQELQNGTLSIIRNHWRSFYLRN